MKRLIALLPLIVGGLRAQSLTTISQIMSNADGSPFAGMIKIYPQRMSSSGVAIYGEPIQACTQGVITGCPVKIAYQSGDPAGTVRLTIQLAANDTASPAQTSYSVIVSPYLAPTTNTRETWYVPTGGPFTIDQVRISGPTSPSIMINPSQISGAGFTTGQAICFNGTTFVAGSCAGGGSGSVNYGVNSVACSSAPSFNLNSQTYSVQSLTLTCNVTSMSFTNLIAGALVTFRLCRDGTNRSFTGWPGTVHGGILNATPIASTCDAQSFFSPDGVNLYPNGSGALNQ